MGCGLRERPPTLWCSVPVSQQSTTVMRAPHYRPRESAFRPRTRASFAPLLGRAPLTIVGSGSDPTLCRVASGPVARTAVGKNAPPEGCWGTLP